MPTIERKPEICARCAVEPVSNGLFLCAGCRAKHYEKFPMDVRGPLEDRQERRRQFRRPSLEEREKLREQRRALEVEHRADHQALHARLDELETKVTTLLKEAP